VINTLRTISVLFLLGYGSRIIQAHFAGITDGDFARFGVEWVSWACLASWQLHGLPAGMTVVYNDVDGASGTV
jgi:hypothetical protein